MPTLDRRTRRIDPTLVTAQNAASPLSIQTPDGSGQVVEPAVEYIPWGWNGHRYWGWITGYTNGNNATENPSLYYSDDGSTWTAVTAIGFPAIAKPSNGNNDDPEIARGPDNNLHLFINQTLGTSAPYTYQIVWCTYDGSVLTTPQVIIGPSTTYGIGGFAMEWDGTNTQWVCWSVDGLGPFPPNPVNRRTCGGSQPNGTWSAPTTCTFVNAPSGRWPWELHVRRRGEQYVMLATWAADQGGATSLLYLAVSGDGLTWTCNPNWILAPSASGWDNHIMYRADLIPLDDGADGLFDIWYSAANASLAWFMGRTKIRTAALSPFNPVGVKTSAYTANPSELVSCNLASAFTVTLPNAPPDRTEVEVAIVSGTQTLTVATQGSDVINAQTLASPSPTPIGTGYGISVTSFTITVPSTGVPIGSLVTVRAGSEAGYTADVFASVSDSRGNTYTKTAQAWADSNTASLDIFYSYLSTALQAGDTITVTLASTLGGAAAAEYWPGGGSFDVGSGVGQGGAAAQITTTTSDLIIAATVQSAGTYSYSAPWTPLQSTSTGYFVSGGYLVAPSGTYSTPNTGQDVSSPYPAVAISGFNGFSPPVFTVSGVGSRQIFQYQASTASWWTR
ncbi:MAG: hypothetical protein ACXVH1_27865 [Solirubrobacteraceae bacterium]